MWTYTYIYILLQYPLSNWDVHPNIAGWESMSNGARVSLPLHSTWLECLCGCASIMCTNHIKSMSNRGWFKPDPGNTLQQSTYPSNSQHFSTEFLLRRTRAQSLKQFLLTMHLHQINGINGSSCIEGIGMGTTSNVGDALLISVPPVQRENWEVCPAKDPTFNSKSNKTGRFWPGIWRWLRCVALTSGSWGALGDK